MNMKPGFTVGDRVVLGEGVASLAPAGTEGTVERIWPDGMLHIVFPASYPSVAVLPSKVRFVEPAPTIDRSSASDGVETRLSNESKCTCRCMKCVTSHCNQGARDGFGNCPPMQSDANVLAAEHEKR